MVFIVFPFYVVCAALVGFCVGGIIGEISVRKNNIGLLVVLLFAGFCQWIGNLAIHYLNSRTDSSILVIVYCLLAVIFALLGIYAARYGAWCEHPTP